MVFQKLSRKRPVLNFLNDRDLFLNQKFDISDHPAMIVRKPLLECHKSSVFKSADQASVRLQQLTFKKNGYNTICR